MSGKISLVWAGVLTILPHLALAADSAGPRAAPPADAIVALADSLPTASIEGICRDAQSAALPESRKAAYQSCLHDEGAARDQLRQKWARYSSAARMTCAEPGGVPISYVELQTCLDMQSGGSLTKPVPGLGAPSLGAMGAPSRMAPAQMK